MRNSIIKYVSVAVLALLVAAPAAWAQVCGNGIVELGEACDDGNAANTDLCLNDCFDAVCGDGHVLEPIVVWEPGPELEVTTTLPGKQERPRVAMADDGTFLLVWEGEDSDKDGVWGQVYDADGWPLSAEFQVNTVSAGKQERPRVAAAPDGSFVVVWQGEDSDNKGIFGIRLDMDGSPLGGEFVVNATEFGKQERPTVEVAGDGSFVVAWQSEDSDGKGIFARRFDANATPLGDDFQANTVEENTQDRPAVAAAADGSFVVVWQGEDADDKGVFGQRFDANGVAVGSEFVVNTTTDAKQDEPDVAAADDGSFVVVWRSPDADKDGVFGQRFGADGLPLGSEFRVNTDETKKQSQARVAMADDGSFFVVWRDDSGGKQILGQRFAADGSPVDLPFQVTDTDSDSEKLDQPAVDMASGGDFVVLWQHQEKKETEVYGRRYANSSVAGEECDEGGWTFTCDHECKSQSIVLDNPLGDLTWYLR
jgi:cysteine-rich repeat protein